MAINVTHSKVSTIPDGDDTSLIRPSDWNDDHVLVGVGTMAEQDANAVAITGGTITGVSVAGYVPTTTTITAGTGLTGGGDLSANRTLAIANTTVTAASYGSASKTLTATVNAQGQLTALADTNIAIANTQVSGLGTASTKDAGVANGVATLDAGGKVPTSQIPLQGDLNYQGTWNATTNTPTLTSSVGTQGYYYVVDVAGTTNLNGITDWQIGDWAIFNGSVWQKVDNTDAVTSVNGQVGTVVLTTTNIAEGTNLYYTDARARAALSAGTGISYANTTGVITNSAPDQIVALTGAGTTTVTGTYPNFTITSTDAYTGDVVGPASATDNAIARFDTTTGKLIQNSVVTVSDTGVIAGAPSISNINFVDFDTTYATTLTEGQLGWDGNNTLGLGMAGGNVIQHIGEDSYYYAKASSAITKGQVCMFTGAVGASGVVTAAPATGISNGQYIMGIAAESIALNGFGLIQGFGVLRNVNTSGFSDGDVVYYDQSVTGGFTKTFPSTGPIVTVAAVVNGGSVGGGSLQVRITVSERNIAGTGISVSQSSSGSTITNTAPDQTVVLTGGTGISTSGTYPNFTITNTSPSSGGTVTSITAGTGLTGGTITSSGTIAIDSSVVTLTGSQILTNKTISGATNTLSNIGNSSLTNSSITINGSAVSLGGSTSVGTVTSVSGTAPISVATGTTTPAVSISQATTSTDGYLSNTDWNTFNGKANAFTYTTSYIPYGQGTTTPNQSSSLTYASSTLTAPVVSASNGLVVNSNTVSASYSIPSGSSAMSVGPMTVASGQTVTVPTGGRWVVL